jgi:hypothetical protein
MRLTMLFRLCARMSRSRRPIRTPGSELFNLASGTDQQIVEHLVTLVPQPTLERVWALLGQHLSSILPREQWRHLWQSMMQVQPDPNPPSPSPYRFRRNNPPPRENA